MALPWFMSLWQGFDRLHWRWRVMIVALLLGSVGAAVLGVVRWRQGRRDPATYLQRGAASLAAGNVQQAVADYRFAVWCAQTPAAKEETVQEIATALAAAPTPAVKEAFERSRLIIAFWAVLLQQVPASELAADKLLDYHYALAKAFELPAFWASLEPVATQILKGAPGNLKAHRYWAYSQVKLATFGQEGSFANLESASTELQTAADTAPDDPEIACFVAMDRFNQALGPAAEKTGGTTREVDLAAITAPLDDFLQKHPGNAVADVSLQQVLLMIYERRPGDELLSRIQTRFAQLAGRLTTAPDPKAALPLVKQCLLFAGRKSTEPRYAGMNQFLEASDALLASVRKAHPDDVRTLLLSGTLARHRRHYDDAMSFFKQAVAGVKIAPDAAQISDWATRLSGHLALVDLSFRQARAARDAEDRKAARELLRDYEERLAEDNFLAADQLKTTAAARQLYLAERYHATAAHLQAALAKGTANAQTIGLAGLALAEAGEVGAAREFLQRALTFPALDPGSYFDYAGKLVDVLLTLRQLDAAETLLNGLLQVWPDDIGLREYQARLVVRQVALSLARHDDDTSKTARRGLEQLTPLVAAGRPDIVRSVVELNSVIGQVSEAAAVLEKFRRAQPENPEMVRLALGFRYRQSDRISPEELDALLQPWQGDTMMPQLRAMLLQRRTEWPQINDLLSVIVEKDGTRKALLRHEYVVAYASPDAAMSFPELKGLPADNFGVLKVRLSEALRLGDVAGAEALVDGLPPDMAKQPRVRFLKAFVMLTTNRVQQAIELLEPALEASPFDSNGWVMLGEARQRSGEPAAAEEPFSRAILIKPNNVNALLHAFRQHREAGDEERAVAVLRHAVRMAPQAPQVRLAFREFLQHLDDPAKELDWRLAYAAVNPGDVSNYRAIARLYLQRGKTEEAEKLLVQLAKRAQSRANLLALAECWLRTGKYEQGVSLLLQRARQGVDGVAGWLDLARYFRMAGRHYEAEKAYEQAMSAASAGDASVAAEFGAYLVQRREFRPARDLYQKLFQETGNSDIGLQLANACLALQDVNAAEEVLAKVAAKGEPTVKFYETEARIAAARNQHDRVMGAFEKAVGLAPDNVRIYISRARYLMARPDRPASDLVLAQSDLDKAIALVPELPLPRELLAEFHVSSRHYTEAVETLEKLLQDFPDREAYFNRLAEVLFTQKKFPALTALLQREAIRRQFGTALSWQTWQARLLAAKGQQPAAEQLLADYLTKHEDPAVLAAFAAFLRSHEKPDAALTLLRKRPELTAKALRLYRLKAELERQLGDGDAAIRTVSSALARTSSEGCPWSVETALRELSIVLASSDLVRALRQIATEIPACQLALGEACLRTLDFAAAVATFRALSEREDAPAQLRRSAKRRLALAYAAGGEMDAAAALYRELGVRPADDVATLNNLAYTLAQAGEKLPRAIALARRALALAPEQAALRAAILDTIGYAQFRAGDLKAAGETFRQSLAAQEQAEVRIHLAQVLLARKETAAAREQLAAARRLAIAAHSKASLDAVIKLEQQLPEE